MWRRVGRVNRGIAVLVGLMLITTACTVGPSRELPLAVSGEFPPTTAATASIELSTITPAPPPRVAPPLVWNQCPSSDEGPAPAAATLDVECALLPVPISHDNPERGEMTLHISRASHDALDDQAPPLVVLLGEPAEHSYLDVGMVAAALPALITDHFEIVTLDVRGLGASTGVECVDDELLNQFMTFPADPASFLGAEDFAAITRTLTFACGDLVGPALTQFNSTNAADDLDMLRAALQVPRLSLVGHGFAATIGAVFADRYPEQVGALVLDSPRDPLSSPQKTATALATVAESQLINFVAACSQFPQGCPLGGDPLSAMSTAIELLPETAVLTYDGEISTGGALIALWRLLPVEDTWLELAEALAAIEFDHGRRLTQLLRESFGSDAAGARISGELLFVCNDSAARLLPDEITEAVATAQIESPLLGAVIAGWESLCASWPAPDTTLKRLSATGAAPIVLIGSVNSSQHPYLGVKAVNGQLSSSTLLSWQSSVDGAYPLSSCITDAVNTYLLSETAPPVGVLCPR